MLRLFVLLISSSLLISACHKDNVTEPETDPRPTMNKQDSLAMVAFYHSIRCTEWKGGFHWDLKDYSTWGGVVAELDKEKNEYRITEIKVPNVTTYLPDSYILPPKLGNLTKLRSLIVFGNRNACRGIPQELFNCPLEPLLIAGDDRYEYAKGFSGTIPKEIGKVANTLKYLKICFTDIGGDIPEEIAKLQKLEFSLYLYADEFTGKVPLFLRELPAGVG